MALLLKMDPSNIEAGAAKARAALDKVKQGAFTAESAIDTLAKQGAADMLRFDAVLKGPAVTATAMQRAFAATQGQTARLTGELQHLGADAMRTSAYMAELEREAHQFSQGVTAVGRASQGSSGQVRMLGQQLSQVVQQGAATGQWGQALAIQLADIGLAFGGVGIAAGIVATVAMPLIMDAFGEGKTAADEATEATDLYGEALSTLQSDISGAQNLHEQYVQAVLQGNASLINAIELEATARQALFEVNRLQEDKAQRAAAAALAAQEAEVAALQKVADERKSDAFGPEKLKEMLQPLEDAKVKLAEQRAEYNLITAQIAVTNEQLVANGDLIEIARNGLVGTNDALDGSRINLQALVDLQTENAGRTREATGEATNLGEALDMAQQFAAMIGANAPQGGFLSGAIADADTLAAKLWNAAAGAAAAALRESVAPLAGPAGMGSPPPTGGAVGTSPRPRRRGVDSATFGGSGGGGGGGGGGAAQVDRTREAYDRLMASLDPVIARTQDMAEATTVANAALAAGDISAAEHAKALELIAEKYGDVSDQMTILGEAGASAFDRMLEEGKLTGDMLKDLAKDIMFATVKAELLKHVTGGSSGMSIGSLLVAGITGGFHDGGGTIPMGEEHFVGEYGIERVKATPMGAVVTSRVETARQMQQPGNGAVKLTVDLGLTVDDEGKIKVMMRNVGQAAHDGAVKTVKQNLGSWSGMLQMDGALA